MGVGSRLRPRERPGAIGTAVRLRAVAWDQAVGCPVAGSPRHLRGRTRSALVHMGCCTWCRPTTGGVRKTAACGSVRLATSISTAPVRTGRCPETSGRSDRLLDRAHPELRLDAQLDPPGGNTTDLQVVLAGVPADNHQAGLGSGRDLNSVPPANDPDSLACEAPGRFRSARCNAPAISRRPIGAMPVRMMLPPPHAADVAEPGLGSDPCAGLCTEPDG